MNGHTLTDLVVSREREAVSRRYAHGRRRGYHLFEGRGRLVYPDGSSDWVNDGFVPNVLMDEGEASVLNVYLREQANPTKYLALVSTVPAAETQTMAAPAFPESETPGTDAYNRQQLTSGEWAAPALDSGDMQSAADEQTFGANTGAGAWAIEAVALVTVATGTGGLYLAYVATGTVSVPQNVAFKYTLRWKNQ